MNLDLKPLLNPVERYARNPVIFSLVCALVLYLVAQQALMTAARPKNVLDTYSYYYAAKAINQGRNPYDVSLLDSLGRAEGGLREVFPYLYPPVLAASLRLLTTLPPLQVHKILLWVNLLLVSLNFYLLFKLVRPQQHPYTLFLSYLIFQPVNFTLLMTLKLGQINPLVTLFILLCLYGHLRGRETLSAAALSVAILLKLTPVILLLYFLLFYPRKWKYLLKVAAATLGLVLLSFLAAPPVDWLYFAKSSSSGTPYITFGSLWGQLAILALSAPFLMQYRIWLYLLLGAAILFFSLRTIRRVSEPQRALYAFSVLILVSLALSPLTWHHHYYFCLLTFFYLPVIYWERGILWLSLSYMAMVFIVQTRFPDALGNFMGPPFDVILSLTQTIMTFVVLLVTILMWPKEAITSPEPPSAPPDDLPI